MTKPTMPEPVAEVLPNNSIRWVAIPPKSIGPGTKFITTTQAEAYKDACVGEALEDVINTLETRQFGGQDQIIRFLRALLPPTK